MATSNDVSSVRMGAGNYLARFAICLLGLAAVAWGVVTLPLFWQQASPSSVAARFVRGDTFKMQSLLDEARQAENADNYPFCNPAALHSLVVLRLAILNESIAGTDPALVQPAYDLAHKATGKALSCAPADAFVWLARFWLDVAKHGYKPDDANYLRLSYALGPNESWIALWRSKLAFALFERLPADLANDAIGEFIGLVDTGRLYWETARIFESAPPAGQSRIVEHLNTASAISRQAFARALYQKGLDVSIPGVERPTARPWEFTLPPASVR